MMNVNVYLVLLVNFVMVSLHAVRYDMRQATRQDVAGVVNLINIQAYKDDDKIVIVPKKFRENYVQQAIDAGRLFVIVQGTEIIGYKKMFCITDESERTEILKDELRLLGSDSVQLNILNSKTQEVQDSSLKLSHLLSQPMTYIYNGADFTHPSHRAKGLNNKLTKYAFDTLLKPTLKDIQARQSAYVALVYGLTKNNAGKGDLLGGRTAGIVRQFEAFAQRVDDLCKQKLPQVSFIARSVAFKPSFDPQSDECKPLPDEKAVPGYGYLIAHLLVNTIKNPKE